MTASRQVRLAARPVGEPKPTDFELVETELPDPGPGELLVRNTWMSVDPYMRGRMNDVESYVPPFGLGEALTGAAVGEVVASADEQVHEGQTVTHFHGWREYAVIGAREARPIDTELAPAPAYLGVLGGPGLTAYVGLTEIAPLREGDTVFVSAAAGAVGSVAGQIAGLRGCRVIGSAGSAEKVAYIRDELGFDAAFNYNDGDVRVLLRQAAPDGIDVYFDNVGGEHLEAALLALRDFGRVCMCGAISMYNATELPPGPRSLPLVVRKRLTLRGFIVSDHMTLTDDFRREVGEWVRAGQIKFRQTEVEGLERAPDAFIGLLRGENIGKMVVRL